MSKVTKTLGPLHFEDLDPHRFEDLVRQIIYDFRRWRSLEPTGRLGSDEGYDARGFEITDEEERAEREEDEEEDDHPVISISTDRIWQIQCKREKSISPANIKKHVDEMEIDPESPPYGVIFSAACDFSKKTRDAFAAEMRQRGVQEFYLWGKGDLEDMLMQPKNDHLLYAYFGVSLVIRQRSLKSQIRSTLGAKRKVIKHLGLVRAHSYSPVLLRDIEDTHYPYMGGIKDFKRRRPWCQMFYQGHYYKGIRILLGRFFAYREIDHKTGELKSWDYSPQPDLAEVPNDPWRKETRTEGDLRFRAYHFWNQIDKDKQAYFEIEGMVPYERIIEIDPAGDTIVTQPHIFVQRKNSRFSDYVVANLQGPDRSSRTYRISNVEDKLRRKFFPDHFPEVKGAEPMLPPTEPASPKA